MYRTAATLLAMTAALAAAPAAQADLPANKDKSIVVGESIGGVKPGMTGKDANKIWKGEGCGEIKADNIFCAFEPVSTGANYYAGFVAFSIGKFPKITTVTLSAAYDVNSPDREPVFPAALLKYKTGAEDGKIGLKSPISKVKGEFGSKLKKTFSQGVSAEYELKGKKGAVTTFDTYRLNGKEVVTKIFIEKA